MRVSRGSRRAAPKSRGTPHSGGVGWRVSFPWRDACTVSVRNCSSVADCCRARQVANRKQSSAVRCGVCTLRRWTHPVDGNRSHGAPERFPLHGTHRSCRYAGATPWWTHFSHKDGGLQNKSLPNWRLCRITWSWCRAHDAKPSGRRTPSKSNTT